MIGTKVRGFRHLCDSVGNHNIKKILLVGMGGCFCRIFVKKTDNRPYNVVLISDQFGTNSVPNWLSNEEIKRFKKEIGNERIFFMEIRNDREYLSHFDYSILLPDNILDEVDNFLTQNKKLCESVVHRYCNAHDYTSLLFYSMSNASPNYYSWALNNFFKYNATHKIIINCLTWIETYPQIIKKLSKGTPLAYNGLKPLIELYEEMVRLRREKRLNDSVNMFNTAQKKLLKNHSFSDKETNIMSKFHILSDEKKLNFVRKMSTIEDTSEIIHQMALLTKAQFSWNKESLLDFINNSEGINCKVVFENEDTIVVRVDNYEAVKYLAKTTNWCISKNKTYWDNYTNTRKVKQYILYDFSKKEDDKLSIVGFTVNDGRFISHAHNFVNDNIVQNAFTIKEQVRQFIPKTDNILDVLKRKNVPPSVFLRDMSYPFKWDRKSFLDYIMRYDNDTIYVVQDDLDNQKLALIWNGSDFFKIFHNKDMFNKHVEKIMIFADFNKPIDEGFMYCNILGSENGLLDEVPDRIGKVYGFGETEISFNQIIKDFGLPLNIIKRVYDDKEEFIDSVAECDIKTMNLMLSKNGFIESLKQNEESIQDRLSSSIRNSLYHYNTIDVIKLLYDYGLKLSEIIGSINVEYLINDIFDDIANRLYGIRNETYDVLDDYEEVLKENDFKANQLTIYGMMYALKIISENESDSTIGDEINFEPFRMLDRHRKLRIELTNMLIKFAINFNSKLEYLLQFIIIDNNISAMKFIIKNDASQSIVKTLLNTLPKDHEIVQSLSIAK